jgi:hypothetical protein
MPEQDRYICPEGKPLKYVGINKLNRVHTYHSTVKRCRGCPQKPQCTRGKYRIVSIHVCEAARQKAYQIAKTPQFAEALRKRRKVEALFSELKNQIGLRRLRLRRIKFVREQFYLAAAAQNLKRLVRFRKHDLIGAPPLSMMDMVVCRNMLIYVKHDMQPLIYEKLCNALAPGGYLVLGKTETPPVEFLNRLETVNLAARIYRRK